MKYVKLLAMIFVLTGCQGYLDVEVIVENTTGHNIKIEGFSYEEESEVITIRPYGNYIQAQNYHPEDSRYYYLFLEDPIDSIYIIFDDERIIVQSCEDYELGLCGELVERNILTIGLNYDREDIDRKEYHFTYQITEEDYDRALPID